MDVKRVESKIINPKQNLKPKREFDYEDNGG